MYQEWLKKYEEIKNEKKSKDKEKTKQSNH